MGGRHETFGPPPPALTIHQLQAHRRPHTFVSAVHIGMGSMLQEHRGQAGGIRLAIVGCGQIGNLHARRIVADGRAQIVALCDSLEANASRLKSEFARDARLFADVAEMAAACPLEAAVICTPTHQHFEQVRLLRNRGISVLCEKPLADSRARIVQLIEETRGDGPSLSAAYHRLRWAVYRTLPLGRVTGTHRYT